MTSLQSAFERQAVDCLLKPLSALRLAETVTRLKARLHAAAQPGSADQTAIALSARQWNTALDKRLHGATVK
jgi:DNA-binding LytR/AlgR family response regulator